MVLFKLLPIFLPPLIIVWLFVRYPDFETRRKRAEMLLVLTPILFPVLLFIVYLISR